MQTQIDNHWMEQFHTILIEQLSNEELDNRMIAELLGLSERQFYRKIKQLTNKTPKQYIREYRLSAAKTYLEKEVYHTVREVCFAVGYVNVHYFDKQFVEAFGQKPSVVLRKSG